MIGGIVGDIAGGSYVFDSVAIELPLDQVSLADFPPSISGGASLSLPVNAVSLTDFPPEIKAVLSVDLPADTVSLTDFAPEIKPVLSIDLPADLVSITDYPPTINLILVLDLPADTVSLQDFAPAISGGASFSLPVDSVSLTDYPPGIDIVIYGVPRFFVSPKVDGVIKLTFTNREGKEIELERSPRHNTNFSHLTFVNADSYDDNVGADNYKYKARFVSRVGGELNATGTFSISKLTTD